MSQQPDKMSSGSVEVEKKWCNPNSVNKIPTVNFHKEYCCMNEFGRKLHI